MQFHTPSRSIPPLDSLQHWGQNYIFFKTIARMKLLFLNCLGDYSYSFQRSVELIYITVAISLFFICKTQLQNIISHWNFQEFIATTFT